MTTLMWWGDSDGVRGRCDAKCHNAKDPECDCMCGGRYHGAGRDGTLQEKVEAYGAELLEAAKERAAREGLELHGRTLADLADYLQTGLDL